MSEGHRTCDHCGAAVARLDDRFCSYCGLELALPPSVPRAQAGDGLGDLPARFLALRRWQRLDAVLAQPPATGLHMAGRAALPAFLLLFVVVSLGIAVSSLGSGAGLLFAIVPLGIGAVGALAMAGSAAQAVRDLRAPLEHCLAAVVGTREQLVGSGEQLRSIQHVTLETDAGERHELQAAGEVVGAASRGDVGLAWTKGGQLIAFVRAPV